VNAAVMVFAVIVAAALHAARPAAGLLGAVPLNPVLGIVIYYALLHGRREMLAAAMVGGLVEDSMGLMPLGYSSFCYCAIGWAAGSYRDVVHVTEPVTYAVFGMAGAACVSLAEWGLLAKDGLVQPDVLFIAARTAAAALSAALVVPAVFAALLWIDRGVGNLEEAET
jgi:rod shape-determining protein MreD